MKTFYVAGIEPLTKMTPFFDGVEAITLWVQMIRNRRIELLEHWVMGSSICSFARTAHSFACFALLASLAHSFVYSLDHSLTYLIASILNNFCPLCIGAFVRRKWAQRNRRRRSQSRSRMTTPEVKPKDDTQGFGSGSGGL